MRVIRRRLIGSTAILGLGCAALSGCQTYPAGFGGMTLPSPHYLKHFPQSFPSDPPYPLQRELDSMQDPEGIARPGLGRGGVAPLPALAPFAPPAPAAPAGGVPPPAGN